MNYTPPMKFEWDEAKSDACFRDRGFDFAYAARMIRQDIRRSHGEGRYRLIGCIDGRLFVLVYTPRNNVIRIISARKANQREVTQYEDRAHDD